MPRRNFGSSFLGGFSQTFNPTFQNVLDNLMQEERQRKIMEEQNRREAEEENKRQQGRNAVMDLLRGGQNVNIPQGITPVLPQGINQFAPYTQEQQIEKIGQIFPEPSQYYNAVSKLLTPKQRKTVKIGNQTFAESPEYENVPVGEPLFTEPKGFEKQIRTNWDLKKNVNGKIIVPKGYFDENNNWIETDFKTITPTVSKKTEYGSKYTDLTKETKKELEDYSKKLQEIKARLDLVKKGVPVFEESWWGGKLPLSETDLINQLNQAQGEYKEYVQNTEPSTVVDYRNTFTKNYGEVDQSNADDLFNYYATFYNDYLDKKIEPAEYLYLLHDFRAKYGFDPATKFNTALNGR